MLELLIAIAISAVLVSILYAVYHAVVRSTESGERLRSVMGRAMTGLDTLSRDIQAAYASGVDSNCVFSLEDLSTPGSDDALLEFCATIVPESEADPRWYDVLRIRYERVRDDAGDRLVRVHAVLGRGDETPRQTNLVARHVAGWHVEVYDGEHWARSWPGGNAPALPQAARFRITIDCGGEQQEFASTVFIPAGNGAAFGSDTETNRPDATDPDDATPQTRIRSI